MNNYLEFLTDLWKITKEDGGFASFSALISKHKVNTSTSVVLRDELSWVHESDNLYIWDKNKPTKKDAEFLATVIKERVKKQRDIKAMTSGVKVKTKLATTKNNVLEPNVPSNLLENTTKEKEHEMYHSTKELEEDINKVLIEEIKEHQSEYEVQELKTTIENLTKQVLNTKICLDTEIVLSNAGIKELQISMRQIEDTNKNLILENENCNNLLIEKNQEIDYLKSITVDLKSVIAISENSVNELSNKYNILKGQNAILEMKLNSSFIKYNKLLEQNEQNEQNLKNAVNLIKVKETCINKLETERNKELNKGFFKKLFS